MRVSLITRSIGGIELDATTSEQHTSEVDISDNPVENGAVMTDHVQPKPREVEITGVVAEVSHKKSVPSRVPKYSRARDFVRVAKTLPSINLIMGLGETAAAKVDQYLGAHKQSASLKPGVNQNSANRRAASVYKALLDLQRRAELITIKSGLVTYKNMILESVSCTETPDGLSSFDITAREVFVTKSRYENVVINKTSPVGGSEASTPSILSTPVQDEGDAHDALEKEPPSLTSQS